MITTSHKEGCVYLFSAALLNFLGYIIPKSDQRSYCLKIGFVNQKICEIELTSPNPNILKKCAASGNVNVPKYVSSFICAEKKNILSGGIVGVGAKLN